MPFIAVGQGVGRNAPNRPADVKAVHKGLMDIGMIPCYVSNGLIDDQLTKGIEALQRHFMFRPDLVISPGGVSLGYLSRWQIKSISPGVQLPGRLREAWDWVNPLLPEGSYCSSGYRSADEQRRILHKFYSMTYRALIVAKYTQKIYDEIAANLTANEQKVLEMVRGVGQAIAAPGASLHQQGKALDVGGPENIDQLQVEVVKVVARAQPALFSGKVIKERNGCVHFEIR